jgi:DNA primase
MKGKRYTKALIEKIKSATNLPDLVRSYTSIDRYNRALCMFHSDTVPSISINSEKGLWYCHGCGAGGDAIKFLMLAEKIDFPKAIKMLAARSGIKLPGK